MVLLNISWLKTLLTVIAIKEMICMDEISCVLPYCRVTLPQLIPMEYQGWLFLIFMTVSFILIIYGFYLIVIGYGIPDNAGKKWKLPIEGDKSMSLISDKNHLCEGYHGEQYLCRAPKSRNYDLWWRLQLGCEDVYEGCENIYTDLPKGQWNMKTLIILLRFDPYRY